MIDDVRLIIAQKLKDSNCSKVAKETGLGYVTLHNVKHGKTKANRRTLDKLTCYYLTR